MNSKFQMRIALHALAIGLSLGLGALSVIAESQGSGSSGQSSQSGQQSNQESVAEAAKKTREKKKEAAAKGKKVYTNDDVSKTKGAGEAAEANAGDKEKTEGTASNESKTDSEAKWRKRFKEARDKLAQTEKELDILQRERQKLMVQFYSDPQKAMDEQYSRKEINDQDAKIDAKKKEIEDMKQHLSDMEDELRESGGDPGWARQE